LNGFLAKSVQPKITKHAYYLDKDRVLVRVTNINVKENRVVLYRYSDHTKYATEYDTAPHYLIPLFKIGEVAKALNRSDETLRRYEYDGLISKPKKYNISKDHKLEIRLYSLQDIMELVHFFNNRNPVGRPSGQDKVSKINEKELIKNLKLRYKEI